jgi:hypothetical protein
MRLTRVLVVLALLAPAVARAEKTENSMPDNAFLFEARLGAGTSIAFGGLSFAGTFTAVPSLLLGARLIGRLHVGLGFGFTRLSNLGGGGGGGTDLNLVTFAPTAAFDLIKSHDERVAFYLKAALPLGPVITCNTGAPCDNNFAISFDLALGARYALHKMFALGLEAGAGGTWIGPQRNNTTGFVSVYGALVGSFMYGK